MFVVCNPHSFSFLMNNRTSTAFKKKSSRDSFYTPGIKSTKYNLEEAHLVLGWLMLTCSIHLETFIKGQQGNVRDEN
jgi:hypothetical protein